MTLTDEQLLALTEHGRQLMTAASGAYLATKNPSRREACVNRIALTARRIAETVMPQDLRYTP